MSKGRDKLTYKERTGHTRVGDVLRSIKGIAPEILAIAGTLTGRESLVELGKMIRGDKNISDKDKQVILKELEKDIIEQQEVTKRWEADLHSDSWLSKNVRPIALLNMLLIFDVLMISALFNRDLMGKIIPLSIPDGYVTLFVSAFLTVLNGYFVLRTVEKRNSKKYGEQ